MPTKLSRYKQSIPDMVAENFGTLDNMINFIIDNRISLSANIQTNTEFIINNEGLGNAEIKKAILNQGLEFNNRYEPASTLTADTTLYTADTTVLTADQI